MLRSYSFARIARREASAETFDNARVLSVEESVNANLSKSLTFVTDANDETAKAIANLFKGAKGAKRTIEVLPNGNKTNKVKVTLSDGREINARVYGANKTALPARDFTADEVAKLTFSYCTQQGQPKTSPCYDASGNASRSIDFYVYMNA